MQRAMEWHVEKERWESDERSERFAAVAENESHQMQADSSISSSPHQFAWVHFSAQQDEASEGASEEGTEKPNFGSAEKTAEPKSAFYKKSKQGYIST